MSITLNLVSSRNYRAVTGTGRQNVGLVWMNCNEMQINLCRFFIVCFVIRDPIIKRRRIEIPLTGWTQPLFSACSNPEPGFGWVFFFQWFEVRGGCSFCWYWWIVDHHCFNFLSIIIILKEGMVTATTSVTDIYYWNG